MRTYGVEEELLVVDQETLRPLPVGTRAADSSVRPSSGSTWPQVTAELQQEQLEVISAPQSTLADQLRAIAAGRVLAEEAAARVGAHVLALPTAPFPLSPHLAPHSRYLRIGEQLGLIAVDHLSNGFHIHVRIYSRQEGVAVLDRIRVWLPTVLALSANSPFWGGVDTEFASYRYQVWSRWPASGPTDVFGSAAGYDRHRAAMLGTGVPLDPGMLYFDARLAEKYPTVEVRVADICLDSGHAAVLATLVRALVETAARAWRHGEPAPEVPASHLSLWSWRASRWGLDDQLVDPATGGLAPARDVVARLLEVVRPVLTEYDEDTAVDKVVADILRNGGGARRQREAYAARHELGDVVALALDATHRPPVIPSADLPRICRGSSTGRGDRRDPGTARGYPDGSPARR
ncbi:carboxylate-amine ligase [Raineyella antarctica]|uniref:Putative glutamate--cysteine ligase 2 n=1 Tax=Raineyella antarctica TaxID=1577474 RepID=A0A1G6I6C6_9ACTN|nr:carboxylate-amine ligase [Raineyella antarctica]